ncbi:MAG: LrgB family protein [Oscillospiraceae bacterium]|nr:LrgB family protein [Oscillospiraceae bacterium]
MNDLVMSSAVFGVVISLVGFWIGSYLKKKFNYAVVNPLLIAIVFVIVILIIFKIDYSAYYSGARYLSYLLTPATVCLAVPLYSQVEKLKKNLVPILCAVFAGVLTSLTSVLAISVVFRLSHLDYVTLLPKSITTAIGMGVAEELGGVTSVTVPVIILTGIFGNLAGEFVCRLFRVTDPIAKGLGIGCASHAIGTSRAMEWGELEGAMSSLSIVISGIFTVVLAPVFASFM